MNLEYLKYRQKQWQKKMQRAAKLEAEKEAARVAKMEAEARKQEEIAARKKLLLEQQEDERLRQKYVQRKEKLEEQKWDKQLDILLAQIEDRFQKDNKLEEIETIMQSREPSLQELDWVGWLVDPLNQRLAALDFDYAMEMFKRDNLLAKQRYRTRPHPPRGHKRKRTNNYVLSFTGNGASGAEDYVKTDFNPDDYDLHLGFTVSYWVRPDEAGNTMFAFGRKFNNDQRFTFGISTVAKIYIGTGGNKLEGRWDSGLEDNPSGKTAAELFPSLFDDGDLIPGTWMHFAVTYADRESTSEGKTDRKVYLNGELIRTQSVNWNDTGGSFTDDGMYFGGRNLKHAGNLPGYDNGWACAVDQVAIFNTAKDADWVASVYNTNRRKLDLSSQSRWGGGLVGYWKFDDEARGDGTTVRDYSGNGNHGTFAAISGDTTAYPGWEKL